MTGALFFAFDAVVEKKVGLLIPSTLTQIKLIAIADKHDVYYDVGVPTLLERELLSVIEIEDDS